jgi:hypothetical protein
MKYPVPMDKQITIANLLGRFLGNLLVICFMAILVTIILTVTIRLCLWIVTF